MRDLTILGIQLVLALIAAMLLVPMILTLAH